MDWWHRMRRGWLAFSTRLKSRKPGGGGSGSSSTCGGGGGGGNVGGGLSKLREDVQMCGYKDVHVMWNMLTVAAPPPPPPPKSTTKRRLSYRRLLFWSNHKLSPSSFSSFS